MADTTPVEKLLEKPFLARTHQDKKRIVMAGKPRPVLRISAVTFTEKEGIVNKDFKVDMYDEIPWLTGCEKRQSLFCWPCLLFEKSGIWTSTGVSDILFLYEGASEHQKTRTHAKAEQKLKEFFTKIEKLREFINSCTTPPTQSSTHISTDSVDNTSCSAKKMPNISCTLYKMETDAKSNSAFPSEKCTDSSSIERTNNTNSKNICDAIYEKNTSFTGSGKETQDISKTIDTSSMMEISVANSVKEIPSMSSVIETTATDSVKEAPGTSFADEMPDISSVNDIPNIRLANEIPDISFANEMPNISSVETPDRNSVKEISNMISMKETSDTVSLHQTSRFHSVEEVPNTSSQFSPIQISIKEVFSENSLMQTTSNTDSVEKNQDSSKETPDFMSVTQTSHIDLSEKILNPSSESNSFQIKIKDVFSESTLIKDIPDNSSMKEIPGNVSMEEVPSSSSEFNPIQISIKEIHPNSLYNSPVNYTRKKHLPKIASSETQDTLPSISSEYNPCQITFTVHSNTSFVEATSNTNSQPGTASVNLMAMPSNKEEEKQVNHQRDKLVIHRFMDGEKPLQNLDHFPFPAVNTNDDDHNKEIKKRIIDACCLAMKLNSSNECPITNDFFSKEKYIKILNLLKNYDYSNKYCFDYAVSLVETTPNVINRIFNALARVVRLEICNEMQSSKYVAVVLNCHTDRDSKSKISCVFRYLNNGVIFERFIGLTEVFNKLSYDVLYNYFETLLKLYNIHDKLCSLSLDGALLQNEDLTNFLDLLKINFPHCFFLPWHAHSINFVLQQSLSFLPTCRQFFKIMASMQAYFQEIPSSLMEIISENHRVLHSALTSSSIITDCTSTQFASSQFIITIKDFRTNFMNFFDSVHKFCHKLDSVTLIKATGFVTYLKQPQTAFLLEIFTQLFNLTDKLNTSLKNHDFEFTDDSVVSKLKSDISEINVKKTIDMLGISSENEEMYIKLFHEIAKLTLFEINTRYMLLLNLKFCKMFNTNVGPEQFKLWAQNLIEVFKEFDETQVCSELVALWKNDSFSKKSVLDFYNLLEEDNLYSSFESLYSIAEVIITMFFEPLSEVNSISKLKLIEKWCDTSSCSSSDDISIIYIESDILHAIKQSPLFHKNVIDIYKENL